MSERLYRLPTGEYTEDHDLYSRSWKEPGEIVAEAMGYWLHGMDPGYSFLSKDHRSNGLCQMTADAVLNLAAKLRSIR